MRHHEPFTIIKRGKVYYYYCYDSYGVRRRFSTGQTNRIKAIRICMQLAEKGELMRVSASATSLTFSDYAKGWWTAECRYVREQTLLGRKLTTGYCRRCKAVVDKWLLPYWGRRYMHTITSSQVEAWLIWLSETKKMAPKSANNCKSILSVMLSQAHHEGLIAGNPCATSRNLSGNAKERGILTVEEARQLFSSLDFWNGNRIAMAANLLAACTGMRNREVAALQPEDLRNGWIHVHSQYDKFGLRPTKTKDERNLPLPLEVMNILRQLAAVGGGKWIFTYDGESPATQTSFVRNLHWACERIGVDWKSRNICFHSWRHFLNSLLINNNISTEMTQHMTGHTTMAMTENYLHFDPSKYSPIVDLTRQIVE